MIHNPNSGIRAIPIQIFLRLNQCSNAVNRLEFRIRFRDTCIILFQAKF